jgi:hypothetical protein
MVFRDTGGRPAFPDVVSKRLLVLVVLAACGPAVSAPDGGEPAGEDTGGQDPPAPSTTASSATSTPTSSTTVTGDESSSSGGFDESTGFGDNPDGGGSVDCDLFEQNCPAGQKCMPYANDGGHSWNATKCTPIADDPKQVDEPCTVEESGVSGVDDCDIGLMCWGLDFETLEGECIPLCIGSPSEPQCEDAERWCTISGDGVLSLCVPTCDPLGSDCDPDDVCAPVYSGEFICVPDASAPGEGNAGDACEALNVCNPGLVCVQGEWVPGCETTGCCTPFCDVTQPECPDSPAQECLPWFEEGKAPPQYEHVGICGVAPE